MEEKIIIQGTCNRIKGAFVENGHAMLTNQRFIYSKQSLAKRLFSKTLSVTTASGEEYQFAFTKLVEWQIAFSNALSAER